MELKTVLFDKPGKEHTESTLKCAIEVAERLGNRKLLVSSTTGYSAQKALEMIPEGFHLVVVTHQQGFREENTNEFDSQLRRELLERGHDVLTATHALSGVERTFRKKFGGLYPAEIVANALRMFSEGVKVAVEIAIMAADAGLARTDEWIVACGGTGRGLDTALVLKPANSAKIFDLKVGSILCMPSGLEL
ncbi:MAG: hypothetical protein J7J80_09495 [Thermotogae bacterium]|nr:hypothetical protein [Thermotogota bacterium]